VSQTIKATGGVAFYYLCLKIFLIQTQKLAFSLALIVGLAIV
jgi:hypothetical protein